MAAAAFLKAGVRIQNPDYNECSEHRPHRQSLLLLGNGNSVWIMGEMIREGKRKIAVNSK
jgi:hypothetical protein